MCIFCDAKKVGVVFIQQTGTFCIEDVERGAELTFSGPLRGPCIIVKFYFQTTKFWLVFWFQTRQTDGRTDGRTDAISMFWAFLVLASYLRRILSTRNAK